jgi:uncharacterized membrane protein YraQ (UPF0718 family)
MELMWDYLKGAVLYVFGTLLHNAPILIIGILIAAAMQVYVNHEKLKNWLMRRSSVSIPATVAFGAFTPFCACGTMAVVISMLATSLPWGPIMAFLTSSPLMSPEGFVLISGIISPAFAVALAAASVIIGAGSGYLSNLVERRTLFFNNQLRFVSSEAVPAASGCGCSGDDSAQTSIASSAVCCNAADDQCGCGSGDTDDITVQACCGAISKPPTRVSSYFVKYKIDKMVKAAVDVGIKKILPYFAVFAAIGYLINRLIPSTWITALFGSQSIFAVPLAAVVGLPLYVNGDSAIPLINSLMQSGVSSGAMLAFLITGPGTSAGVMAGIATIIKKRALGLYVAFILAGAIILGYAYELILALI